MVLIIIGFSFLISFIAQAQTPQHCWDMANTQADITDSCGSLTLTWIGKDELFSDGLYGTPVCESYGCFILQDAFFRASVPSNLAATWTVALWYRDAMGLGLIFQIIVSQRYTRTNRMVVMSFFSIILMKSFFLNGEHTLERFLISRPNFQAQNGLWPFSTQTKQAIEEALLSSSRGKDCSVTKELRLIWLPIPQGSIF